MKHKLLATLLLLAPLLLALAPTALASTTWYVNGVSGSNSNNCKSPTTACKTIVHAISLAASGDSIKVAPATYTEKLTIGISLKILGSGAPRTIIDGGAVNTVAVILSATHVTLSGVTIRNGIGSGGGGIVNDGILTVIDSIVSGNKAASFCRAFCGAAGGGILNDDNGTMIVSNSTLSGNVVQTDCEGDCTARGGGIFNLGRLTITNSTLSGNKAAFVCRVSCGAFGGGIYNFTGAAMTISNSTLAGNGATIGGGIENIGSATLQNSIVANSPSGGNCGGTMKSNGYNLSSDSTCNFNNTGDLNNTDPKLGPLQNNGGPTPTMALSSGSPAVDAGNPSGCTDNLGRLLKTDQRGKPRPDTEDIGGCDIGAYERQSD